jgi:hypothetical protein
VPGFPCRATLTHCLATCPGVLLTETLCLLSQHVVRPQSALPFLLHLDCCCLTQLVLTGTYSYLGFDCGAAAAQRVALQAHTTRWYAYPYGLLTHTGWAWVGLSTWMRAKATSSPDLPRPLDGL